MKCFNCGSTMQRKGYQHVTKIGGFTVTDASCLVPICGKCGEVSLSEEALAGYQRRATALVLTQGGVVGGDVLKFARKVLGLRQKDLAAILRFNEQQVSRWENDKELAMDLRLAVAMLLALPETRALGTVEDVGTHGRELAILKAS